MFMKAWQHLKTVMRHKRLVRQGCFKVGLYRQGIFHDLSKFSPTEFMVGAKYFRGDVSPNNIERQEKGLSYSWLHHKGRNKHHIEYWIDFGFEPGQTLVGMRIPEKYVVEMVMDRIAASKVYQKEKYTDASSLQYYLRGKDHLVMHDESRQLLEHMLKLLAQQGEEALYEYIRKEVLNR
ncbi:hypothetical protein SAMN02910417_00852 [Eubacterium oxidoreducens]|uniref:Catalase n=2 Tax=Eubacterium oxidoreducens TaxID=1732 RepID=A0A1G6AQH5_EUBOX|nr:hypothetical protein SAMN02910417_00852 [Eubacterium oxidoreducens]